MWCPDLKLLTICIFYLACVEIVSANRTKRQIVFENDERSNRVPESNCRTPDNRPGNCVRLISCPALRSTANRNRLRRYVCGFEGSEPKICCPLPPEDTVRNLELSSTTTRRPTRTRRTSPTPTERTTTPRITNFGGVSNKPSFLPEKCGVALTTKTRVVGGQEAISGSWPWMAVVYLMKKNGGMSADCGGSLVTRQHVITAAHCVVTGRSSAAIDPNQLRVRLGAHDLRVGNEEGAVTVPVQSVRKHEQFDPRTYRNDIAVLKLSRPVDFTKRIAPICLPYDSLRNESLTGKSSFVTGFGTMAFNGPSSDVLMEVSFDIQSQEDCRRAYQRDLEITRVYLCAGTMDGTKDSCQGDSGGPLMAIGSGSRFYLVGVVSFGKLCAQPGYPGVYTRVTEFLDWLTRNLSD